MVAVRGFDNDLVLELPFVAALIALAGDRPRPQAAPEQDRLPDGGLRRDRDRCSSTSDDLVENLIAGAGAFLFLLLAVLAYPRGMGMGDVKLAGAMGLYLGLSVIPGAAGGVPVRLGRRAS